MIRQINSRFLKIACPRCGFPHIIYSRSTIKIKCRKCNQLLIKTTGGKIKIKAPVREIIK